MTNDAASMERCKVLEGTLNSVSSKFVPTPSVNWLQNSTAKNFYVFRNGLRWLQWWKPENQSQSQNQNQSDSSELESETDQDSSGLGSNLRPKFTRAPMADTNYEYFLSCLAENLSNNIEIEAKRTNIMDQNIREAIQELSKYEDVVMVPTDKTNKFVAMETEFYKKSILAHLEKEAVIINHKEVNRRITNFKQHLAKFKSDFSTKEYRLISEFAAMREIGMIYGLYKDHKKEPNSFRLINPMSTHPLAGARRVAVKALENLFNRNGVKREFTVKNSFELKKQVQKINFPNIKGKKLYLCTVDVQSMYPSIDFELVERSLHWTAARYKFNDTDWQLLDKILDLLEACNDLNVGQFRENYWDFRRSGDSSPGLVMGSQESAYLADHVMEFLYSLAKEKGLIGGNLWNYRDDGCYIDYFVSDKQADRWFRRLNEAFSNETNGKIVLKLEKGNEITFLDARMKIENDDQGNNKIQFTVFAKPLYNIQYLNRSSTHTNATFKSIPYGVFKRLTGLTSDIGDFFVPMVNYPEHTEKLLQAGLIDEEFAYSNVATDQYKANKESKKKKKRKTLHLTIPFCPQRYKQPITKVVMQTMRNCRDVKFRYSTSYTKCPNLISIIKGDLMRKVQLGIIDADFRLQDCLSNPTRPGRYSCNKPKFGTYKNNPCKFSDNMCRTTGGIYSISCPIEGCNKKYFGSTKKMLKERVGDHLSDVVTLLATSPPKSADSFTQHLKTAHGDEFFDLIEKFREENDFRGRIGRAVLWQYFDLNLVKQATVKYQGTMDCSLCAAERGVIWRMMRQGKAMNRNRDWHGRCRHLYKSCVTNFVKVEE